MTANFLAVATAATGARLGCAGRRRTISKRRERLGRPRCFNERVPIRAPRTLDDVRAGSAEIGFELLHDLAVAARGPIEPLLVAADDENEGIDVNGVELCPLQFGVQNFHAGSQLSSLSRPTSEIAPSDQGSSISPSPQKIQTLRAA